MTRKSKSDSIRKKLSNLAHKLNVPYRNLETVFLIERLVARLVADKKLSQHLVFKGGPTPYQQWQMHQNLKSPLILL